jgi:hypothetical protein
MKLTFQRWTLGAYLLTAFMLSLYFAVYASVLGFIGYVAWHFIKKVW